MHLPLTEPAIGAFTAATLLCVLSFTGVSSGPLSTAWWIVLVAGLAFGAPAALSGVTAWRTIDRGSAARRSAVAHTLMMSAVIALFAAAAVAAYVRRGGTIGVPSLALTVAGFLVLVLGGLLGTRGRR